MSGLGDYVHYAVKNYQRYGVSYKGETPSHYSGNINNYIQQRKNIQYSTNFNYSNLEQELRKNTPNILIQEQQALNLDYGQKINQFKSLLMAKATGKGNTTFSNLKSNKKESDLITAKKQFDQLQKKIEYYNLQLAEGKTVYAPVLQELVQQYQTLAAGSQRISILGNIQQGWNDYSAKTWEEKLNGDLGNKIEESIKTSSKSAAQKAFKNIVNSIPNTIENITTDNGITVYQTQDKVGSSYKINATSEGWELEFKGKRTNILTGSMNNIYHDEVGYAGVSFNGEISLSTVLNMLEAENKFGTHWMNLHASQLNSSLDSNLRKAIIYEMLGTTNSQLDQSGDFVFIDRNSGQVNHHSFWEVAEMAEFRIQPDPTNQRLNNNWVPPNRPSKESAYLRVNNLLQQVHATQLQVASNRVYI